MRRARGTVGPRSAPGWLAAVLVSAGLGAGVAPPGAVGYVAGDGAGEPARDCFIGFEGYDVGDLSPYGPNGKPAVRCRDGDGCDRDGMPNGVCRFPIAVVLNEPGVPGCTPSALRRYRAQARTRGTRIDFGTFFRPLLDGSSATSAFVDFPVSVRHHGMARARPGKGVLKLRAGRPVDRDVFRFVCDPWLERVGGEPPVGRADWAGPWALAGDVAPGGCTIPTFADELVIERSESGRYKAVVAGVPVDGWPTEEGLDLYGWLGAGHCATGGFDLNVSAHIRGRPRDRVLDLEMFYGHFPLFGSCPCSARWVGTMSRARGR